MFFCITYLCTKFLFVYVFFLIFMVNFRRYDMGDFMRDRERVFELRKNLIDDWRYRGLGCARYVINTGSVKDGSIR